MSCGWLLVVDERTVVMLMDEWKLFQESSEE